MFTCTNGTPHQHSLAIEARICYGLVKPNLPVSPHVPVRGVTTAQLDYIRDLGGDAVYAAKLTRLAASSYIESLKKGSRMTASAPTQPKPRPVDKRLEMITGLIEFIPDGYFAVRLDDESPLTFMRVSRPSSKAKNYAGCVKVQTQHGDRLELAAVMNPYKRWSTYGRNNIVENLMLLVCDYKTSALRYAQELGHCCRCNKQLTDARSRWYGIGPECEGHFSWVIEQVDEERGAFVG